MSAAKLEALYAEQAKERKGSRTDLGLNLGPGELGRSAEKAAKYMGVSHYAIRHSIMRDQGSGTIVNISSQVARAIYTGLSACGHPH